MTYVGDADGLACNPLPALSLNGLFVLIERGTCSFAAKMTNATNAGAIGVVFYNNTTSPVSAIGLGAFTQQVMLISNSDGMNLKSFIDANPGAIVTLNPSAVEVPLNSAANQLPGYSSRGPALGTNAIKPETW